MQIYLCMGIGSNSSEHGKSKEENFMMHDDRILNKIPLVMQSSGRNLFANALERNVVLSSLEHAPGLHRCCGQFESVRLRDRTSERQEEDRRTGQSGVCSRVCRQIRCEDRSDRGGGPGSLRTKRQQCFWWVLKWKMDSLLLNWLLL